MNPAIAQHIYSYRNFHSYLADTFSLAKTRNPSYSLTAWSKALGYNSPSFLNDVMKGRRKPNQHLVGQLKDNLKLEGRAGDYLELLAEKSRNAKKIAPNFYDRVLDAISDNNSDHTTICDTESYHLISEWWYSALLEMPNLASFKLTVDSAFEALARRVSRPSIEEALARLVRLRYLDLDSGEYKRSKHPHVQAGSTTPSSAIRSHHTQMIALASDAVENQSIDQRYLMGSTFVIDEDCYKKLVHMIETFHEQVVKNSKTNVGKKIYRLNTQLFALSTGVQS